MGSRETKKIKLEEIVTPLLLWYGKNARKLAWRENKNPYRIWISEIMLQQTRVGAATDYFLRFVEALPDVHALAEASEERLLKLWEGLGYYSRVRNLQKAAREIEQRYGGKLPASCNELRTLPGIGAYTAGAIASIAFGLPCPAVDGNVLRVWARVTGDAGDIMQLQTKRRAEEALRGIIPTDAAGDFTQALMELGALVCLPNGEPLCTDCPLRSFCVAYGKGMQMQLPVKQAKAARRIEQKTMLILTDGCRVAVRKRPEKGLLAGLWELPSIEGFLDVEEVARYVCDAGMEPVEIHLGVQAKHVFTHIEWQMRGVHVRVEKTTGNFVWADNVQLREYAIPSAFRAFKPLLEV